MDLCLRSYRGRLLVAALLGLLLVALLRPLWILAGLLLLYACLRVRARLGRLRLPWRRRPAPQPSPPVLAPQTRRRVLLVGAPLGLLACTVLASGALRGHLGARREAEAAAARFARAVELLDARGAEARLGGVELLAGLAVEAGAYRGPARAQEPGLRLQPVTDAATGATVWRGTLEVPENRVRGAGRSIQLNVAVLKATGPDPVPDPVFVLAGGPGQAATTLVRGSVGSWMRERRDLVFVDQRGTGRSQPLRCALAGSDDDLQSYLEPFFDPERVRACREALEARADLRFYTTPLAMDDLDDVRAALGYERINLVGGSYGTRAALVYMRRHADRVRCAILNGVAPIAFRNPLEHARAAELGFQALLDEIAAEPRYRAAFPDLEKELWVVLDRLAAEPARVEVRHPATGEPAEVILTRDAFAEALRVMMYYVRGNRQVPLLIHRAYEGDLAPFAQRAIESNRSLRNVVAFGMLLCVTCPEDVARIDPGEIAAATSWAFLGDVRVRRQLAACAEWSGGVVPGDYGEPVAVDTPVLLLSGTHDPVTPPVFGAEAASHLPNSLHVVAPGAHGVGGPCIEGIQRAFLERPSVAGLDTSCVRGMRLPPLALPD